MRAPGEVGVGRGRVCVCGGGGGKRGENTIKSRHEVTVVLYTCPLPPCYLSQAATSKASALLTFTGLIRYSSVP